MLAARQPVPLPDEFYDPRVRPGHVLVTGAPVEGERVLLTAVSCIHVFGDTWFFVEHVQDAYVPDNRWLIGVDLHTGRRCRKLVAVSRLIVERLATTGSP